MHKKPLKANLERLLFYYLAFFVMTYYPWLVASDLPQLRLAVGFVGIQLFPADSRLHRFGVVSVPGAVPCWFVSTEKPQLLKASIVATNLWMFPKFQNYFGSQKSRKSRKKVATRKNLAFSSYHLNFNFAQIFL
jgi:hypothetical protein